MNASLRNFLIVVFGVLFAVVCAVDLAQEHYALVTAACAALLWLGLEWIGGPPADAWLLALAFGGYVLGNRGFAQMHLAAQFPLLPAELVLIVATPALVLRMAAKRLSFPRRDPLNLLVFLWVLFGVSRLPLDMRRHGILALRDFAMVYYAAFFFIAQAFLQHPSSAKLLRRAIDISFVSLPWVVIAYRFAPDFILSHITWRGTPLIFHKSDQIATFLAAGFYWLWTRGAQGKGRVWLIPAIASLLLIGTLASPRAAMVAAGGVTFAWVLAGHWRIFTAQVTIVTVAASVALTVFFLGGRNLQTTGVYSIYEHALSVFDFQGRGSYLHQESGDPGDNNRFRLVWWRAVALETWHENPAFGLGFGSDLADRFLADYDLLMAEEFTTRSPHSMIMSAFGRMGALGLLLWLAIAGAMIAMTRTIFRSGSWDAMGYASIAWIVWTSACFGVVLESPMGAVVFWTTLGLANAAKSGSTVVREAALPAVAASSIPSGELEAPAVR